jgi:predicted GIY-YIG superfamily endonuclease
MTACETHSVYRLYNRHGALLYVGCTSNFEKRLGEHRRKSWAREVTRHVVEEHPDRKSALAAERAAIRAECPRHNKTGLDPAVLGEGTAMFRITIRNCTILAGRRGDEQTPCVMLIPHHGREFDYSVAIPKAIKLYDRLARALGLPPRVVPNGES